MREGGERGRDRRRKGRRIRGRGKKKEQRERERKVGMSRRNKSPINQTSVFFMIVFWAYLYFGKS